MKANQRELLHTSMKSLSQETHGKETFEKIRRAILNIPEAMINSSENSESVTLNRWALLAEFYVHPKSRDALTDYFKKLGPQGRNSILNDGMGNFKRDKLHELHRICMDDVATDVTNGFSEEWKALKCIHPENGSFLHLDNFTDLMTEMKNTFDILKSNLSQSGTQESGEILDTTAFEFCKSGQRTCKLNHFYLWLRWKDEDVQFLSNTLAEGVAASGSSATPYARSAPAAEKGSSVKVSGAVRRAARNDHSKKMADCFGESLSRTLTSLQSPSAPSASELAKQKKEEEATKAITLKRMRDTLESASFTSLSPTIQQRLTDCYVEELEKSFFL
jgi:hypothetical protein